MILQLDGRSFEHICHIRLVISEKHDGLSELEHGGGGAKAGGAPALIALCAFEFDLAVPVTLGVDHDMKIQTHSLPHCLGIYNRIDQTT
jgi:hypothetical protein